MWCVSPIHSSSEFIPRRRQLTKLALAGRRFSWGERPPCPSSSEGSPHPRPLGRGSPLPVAPPPPAGFRSHCPAHGSPSGRGVDGGDPRPRRLRRLWRRRHRPRGPCPRRLSVLPIPLPGTYLILDSRNVLCAECFWFPSWVCSSGSRISCFRSQKCLLGYLEKVVRCWEQRIACCHEYLYRKRLRCGGALRMATTARSLPDKPNTSSLSVTSLISADCRVAPWIPCFHVENHDRNNQPGDPSLIRDNT